MTTFLISLRHAHTVRNQQGGLQEFILCSWRFFVRGQTRSEAASRKNLRLKPLAAHCFCTHTIASHAVTKVLSMIFWDIIVWRNWNCSYFWKDLILDNRDAQLCLAVARYSRKSDQKIQHWSILHAHFLLPVLCLALSSLQKLSFWLPVCKFFP